MKIPQKWRFKINFLKNIKSFEFIAVVLMLIIAAGLIVVLRRGGAKSEIDQFVPTAKNEEQKIDELVNKLNQEDTENQTDNPGQPSQDEIQKLLLQANVKKEYLGLKDKKRIDFGEIEKSYETISGFDQDCDQLNLYLGDLENQSPTMQSLVDNLPFKDDQDQEFLITDNYDLMEIVFRELPKESEYNKWYKNDFPKAEGVVNYCNGL